MSAQDVTSDYEILKQHGHTPAKAAEIVLDIKRGNSYAIKWMAGLRALLAETVQRSA